MLHIELAQQAAYSLFNETDYLNHSATLQAIEDSFFQLEAELEMNNVKSAASIKGLQEFYKEVRQWYGFLPYEVDQYFNKLALASLEESMASSYEEAISDDLLGFEEVDDLPF